VIGVQQLTMGEMVKAAVERLKELH